MAARHPTYERLLRALERVLAVPPIGTTDVGAAFDGTPQLANNWPTRGVPADRAIEAQKKWGINSVWIKYDEGPMLLDAKVSHDLRDQRDTIAAVMRIVHELHDIAVEPLSEEQEEKARNAALDLVLEVGADVILSGGQLQPAMKRVAATVRSQ